MSDRDQRLARWAARLIPDPVWDEVEPMTDIAAGRHLSERHLVAGGPEDLWYEMTSSGMRFFVPRPAFDEAYEEAINRGLPPKAAEAGALARLTAFSTHAQLSWTQVVRARRELLVPAQPGMF